MDTLRIIASEIASCTQCPLYKKAHLGVSGEGPLNAKIFFIGQAPGKQEDRSGKPFVGRAGRYLVSELERIGICREDVFITSSVKHFPPHNRAPTPAEIRACRPYLLRQIACVNPPFVVLLGKTAATLKGHSILLGRTVIETVHPSAAMRFPKHAKRFLSDLKRLSKQVKIQTQII